MSRATPEWKLVFQDISLELKMVTLAVPSPHDEFGWLMLDCLRYTADTEEDFLDSLVLAKFREPLTLYLEREERKEV